MFVFDGVNRIAFDDSFNSVLDLPSIYTAWVDWLLLSDNTKFEKAFDTIEDLQNGIPLNLFLVNGWKIRLKGNTSTYTKTVSGGVLLTEDGSEPIVPVSSGVEPRVRYSQPVQAIGYNTGDGGFSQQESLKIDFIKSVLEGDIIPKANTWKIIHRLTKETLVEKDANTNTDGLTELTE